MKRYNLSWGFKLNISKCWTPYFKFNHTPLETKDILCSIGFKESPFVQHNRDAGCKRQSVYDLERKVEEPFRLHARIYEDSTVRVHLETDLSALVHRVADEVVNRFYKKEGNWLVRLVRATYYAVKKFSSFKMAFALHNENSIRSGVDTGDYTSGAMLTKEFLNHMDFVKYEIEHELREQVTYEESMNLFKKMRRLCR